MEVGSPEWIEASLARLDDLERERGQHEEAIETSDDPAALKQHTAALDRLDTEIKSLYAQLEAVAEDDDAEDNDDGVVADLAPSVTQGDDELSAPHFAASAPGAAAATAASEAVAEPLASAAGSPFGGPSSSPAGGPGFDAPAPLPYDDDLKPQGAGGKWVFLGVVLLAAAGIGGFFAWKNIQANKPAEKQGPTEPETVIKAAEVPDDTEAPNAAQGGDATISPNANPTANNGGNNNNKKTKKEEKKTKPIELKGGDGPL